MSLYHPDMASQFTVLLAQREHQLSQALAALDADNEPVANQEVSDFKQLADRRVDADMDELQAARLQRSLAQVAAARHRLAQGRYGHCQECGQPMPLGRLQVMPEAQYCTTCQAAHEFPGR